MTESGARDVRLTLSPSAIYVQQAQVVQAQLKEIGITVEIIPAATQAGGPTFAKGDYDLSWAQVNSVDPAETMNTVYFNANGGLIPPAEQGEFKPLNDQLSDPTKSQDERKEIYADIAEKLYAKAYTVPVCNASQVWIHDGSVANIDDIMNAWSGLVDFRYLYKKKA
jgi:peptide/nickel transport system substrate-binding protein